MSRILLATLLTFVISMSSVVPKLNSGTGLCNNPSDIALFQKEYSTLHGMLQNCAENCFGAGACAASCLQSQSGLSAPCTSCFGDDINCTQTHCMSLCMMNPSSADCLACNKQYCTPALETCSGTPTPP